ncbi:MAG: hypothetical protein Q9226_006871 [Calogaya cf. arnoldii]
MQEATLDISPKTQLEGIQNIMLEISRLMRQLYDTLDIHTRMKLLNAQQRDLEGAILRSDSSSDRHIVYKLAEDTFGFTPVSKMSSDSEVHNKQLLEAIDRDDVTAVKSLLDEGAWAAVKYRDVLGCSPLIFSARQGRLRISEILLYHGANPKAMTTRLPQHSAAEGGHTEILRLLLSQKAVDHSAVDTFGRTALHYAAGSGNPTTVQFLLQLDGIIVDSVDQGGVSPLFAAFSRPFFSLPWGQPGLEVTLAEKEIVHQLLAVPVVNPNRQHPSELKPTLLCTALWKQDMTIVEMLLSRPDIDIHKTLRGDKGGADTFWIAFYRFNETAARMLMEKGADTNYRSLQNNTLWNLYKRLRHSATGFSGKEFFLKFALSNARFPVDTGIWPKKRTDLIDAAEKGHTSVVQMLLGFGASVTKSDDEGRTALSCAAARGHKEIVQLLLSANADIHHRDNNGHTPLVLAVANLRCRLERAELEVQRAHVNEVRLLVEHGANPGDVPSTENAPCDPTCWADAATKFKGILMGRFRDSDDEVIMKSLDQPVLKSSSANATQQEGTSKTSKPIAGNQESHQASKDSEVDTNPVPNPKASALPDYEGPSKPAKRNPKELAGESLEGNKKTPSEKPVAPVLYMELEDEFSAKMNL